MFPGQDQNRGICSLKEQEEDEDLGALSFLLYAGPQFLDLDQKKRMVYAFQEENMKKKKRKRMKRGWKTRSTRHPGQGRILVSGLRPEEE